MTKKSRDRRFFNRIGKKIGLENAVPLPDGHPFNELIKTFIKSHPGSKVVNSRKVPNIGDNEKNILQTNQ